MLFWVQSFTDHDEPCLFVGPSTLFERKNLFYIRMVLWCWFVFLFLTYGKKRWFLDMDISWVLLHFIQFLLFWRSLSSLVGAHCWFYLFVVLEFLFPIFHVLNIDHCLVCIFTNKSFIYTLLKSLFSKRGSIIL